MLKIIIIVIVIIVLILAAYEPSSIFISKKLTQKYEKDYVLLDETAHVSSEHYTLENISGSYDDYNSYYVGDTDVPFFTTMSTDRNRLAYLKLPEDMEIKGGGNSREKFDKIQKDSKILILAPRIMGVEDILDSIK